MRIRHAVPNHNATIAIPNTKTAETCTALQAFEESASSSPAARAFLPYTHSNKGEAISVVTTAIKTMTENSAGWMIPG